MQTCFSPLANPDVSAALNCAKSGPNAAVTDYHRSWRWRQLRFLAKNINYSAVTSNLVDRFNHQEVQQDYLIARGGSHAVCDSYWANSRNSPFCFHSGTTTIHVNFSICSAQTLGRTPRHPATQSMCPDDVGRRHLMGHDDVSSEHPAQSHPAFLFCILHKRRMSLSLERLIRCWHLGNTFC